MTIYQVEGYDHDAAVREGWAIDAFGSVISIDNVKFPSNSDARDWVLNQAALGNRLAEQAVAEATKRRLLR